MMSWDKHDKESRWHFKFAKWHLTGERCILLLFLFLSVNANNITFVKFFAGLTFKNKYIHVLFLHGCTFLDQWKLVPNHTLSYLEKTLCDVTSCGKRSDLTRWACSVGLSGIINLRTHSTSPGQDQDGGFVFLTTTRTNDNQRYWELLCATKGLFNIIFFLLVNSFEPHKHILCVRGLCDL